VYETGRIGTTSVAGARISETRADRAKPKELVVPAKEPEPEAEPAAARQGDINAERLDHEVRARFALLRDCRGEVARRKRVSAGEVAAERLTLRWTILPSGQVAATQVVATSRVDGLVMDCVKREMSQWQFTAPRGGPVRVERPFRFTADDRAGRRGPGTGHPRTTPARVHRPRASRAHAAQKG
jgi:hypothetical protein